MVARPRHLDHPHLLLQEGDERHEELAVQPALVKVVRRAVGGGHQHHPPLEQRLEQPAQDHGVGRIGHLQLVEAQQARLGGDQAGDRPDRVVAAVGPEPRLALGGAPPAPGVDQAVDLGHEGVEVLAPLRPPPGRTGRTGPSAWTCPAPPDPRGRGRAAPWAARTGAGPTARPGCSAPPPARPGRPAPCSGRRRERSRPPPGGGGRRWRGVSAIPPRLAPRRPPLQSPPAAEGKDAARAPKRRTA